MNYQIIKTSQFKSDFKKMIKRGVNIDEFKNILNKLANGDSIPEKYKDRPLKNSKDLINCRELHIEPDWLLVYKYSYDIVILYLIRTGSHSDIF